MRRRFGLLVIDGCSAETLNELVRWLPLSQSGLANFHRSTLKSFHANGSAQAIWAEILTGRPWYLNGCAGYAKPDRDLNQMSVVDEDGLASPIALFNEDESQPVICSNIPLLKGKPGRLWLADGSLPIAMAVHPRKLLEYLPDDYRARPFAAMVLALGERESSALGAIRAEQSRLEAVIRLVETEDWSRLIVRISVVDMLLHLFGLDFFRGQLRVRPAFLELFATLDRLLYQLLSLSDLELFISSTYTVTECFHRANINDALRQAGILRALDAESAQSRLQSHRSAALQQAQGLSISKEFFFTYENRLDLANSRAASPVSGAVFINSKTRFPASGIVEDDEVNAVRVQVLDAITGYFRRFGGTNLTFVDNPLALGDRVPGTPDLLVQAPNIEFYDVTGVRVDEHPETTHIGAGWLMGRSRFSSRELYTTDMSSLLPG